MKAKAALLLTLFAVAFVCGCSRTARREERDAFRLTNGGNAAVGKLQIRKYGCYTCHTISGVPGARGLVGPPLNGVRERTYIAGEIANTPGNLMSWIQHPHQVEAHTIMPEMKVTEQDSRDIAAYLYTLH
jgi:cytochrome c